MADPICTFAISEESKKKLEFIATKEDRSMSSIIRRIIEEYLSKQK
jgi:predicted transcriptional regulator